MFAYGKEDDVGGFSAGGGPAPARGRAGLELVAEFWGRVTSRRFGIERLEAEFTGSGVLGGVRVVDVGTLAYGGVPESFGGDLDIGFMGEDGAPVASLTAMHVGRHLSRSSVNLWAVGTLDAPGCFPRGQSVRLDAEVRGSRYQYWVWAGGGLGEGRSQGGHRAAAERCGPVPAGDGSDVPPAGSRVGRLSIVRGKAAGGGMAGGDDRAGGVRADLLKNWNTYLAVVTGQLSSFGYHRAEDAVTQALIWLWSHPERYDEQRGTIRAFVRVNAKSLLCRPGRPDDQGPRPPDASQRRSHPLEAGGNPQVRWEQRPFSAEVLTVPDIAIETLCWGKECDGVGPDVVALWREAARRCLLEHQTVVRFLVQSGLCAATPGAARVAKHRLLTGLRNDCGLLGLPSIAAGAPRPKNAVLLHQTLDQHKDVKAYGYLFAACDLEGLRRLLDAGVRLVVIRRAEPPQPPLTVVRSKGKPFLIARDGDRLGTLHAHLVDPVGSPAGWVFSPAPRAFRGRKGF